MTLSSAHKRTVHAGRARLVVSRACVALLLATAPSAFAQQWRSALYPTSWQPPAATANFATDQIIQDFSYAGYHRGEVPIPNPSSPVFTVTDPAYGADPTGAQDSTAAIQTAIDAAQTAGDGVVYFPAGTYKVAPPAGKDYALRISASGVVLRGAGTSSTKILNSTSNMRGKSIILVQADLPLDWRVASGAGSALASNLTGPATAIPVADASIFSVGEWVSVHCDATDAWANEQLESDWVGQGATLGGLAYLRKVTAVDTGTNTVTVDIPTRFALKTRDNARVDPVATPLTEIGLENFSIGNVQSSKTTGWGEDDYATSGAGAYECHASYAIYVTGAADSWIRNVSSFQPAGNTSTAHLLSNGIRLTFCRTMTLQGCSLQRPQYGGGGGNGYLYRLDDSGDNLLQDCTATFARHGFIFAEMATSGNVLYHCVDSQTARYTGSTGSVVAGGQGSEHHMHFSHSNLVDSCTADSSFFLAVYRPFGTNPKHDLTAAHSVFWNTLGRGDTTWVGAEGSYVVASQQARYGYVIGTRGTRNQVLTSLYYHSVDSTTKTAPVDFVEGVGQGDDLAPASLYEDQVERRIGQAIFRVSAGSDQSIDPPTDGVKLTASVANGPPASQVAGAATFAWSVVSAPGTATFSSASSASPTVTLSAAGTYEFRVTGAWSGQTSTDTVLVTLSGSVAAKRTIDTLATKDTTLRGGSFAGTAYGNDSTLQLKKSDQADYVREVLLQFTPVKVAASAVSKAEIVLTPTASAGAYSGQVRTVDDTTWNEGTTTWNNQPAAGSITSGWQATDASPVSIDVTSAVKAALTAGSTSVSFLLEASSQAVVDNVVSFRSKEGSRTTGPMLRMTVLASALPATASTLTMQIVTRKVILHGSKRSRVAGVVVSSAGVSAIAISVKRRSVAGRVLANGRWSANVRLKPGKNLVVARATDVTGLSVQTSRTIRAL